MLAVATTEQIVFWLQTLTLKNSTIELRAIRKGRGAVVAHCSQDMPNQIGETIERLSVGAQGVYWLMNPLPADWNGGTAKDKDIEQRRWLLLDCDPTRLSDCSATDSEKELAVAKANEVRDYLTSAGWPFPVEADSGNGRHLLYRVALHGDDGGLIQTLLQLLSRRFSEAAVKLDTTVYNASRICKLYGTVAAKGDETPERPHRISTVIEMPAELVSVSREQLDSEIAKLSEIFPSEKTSNKSREKPAIKNSIGDNPELPHGLPTNGKMVHGDGRHAELRDESARQWRQRVTTLGEKCFSDPKIFEDSVLELDAFQRLIFAVPIELTTVRRYSFDGRKFVQKQFTADVVDGEFKLVIIQAKPKKYKLWSKFWDDFVTLDSHQMYDWCAICVAALEQREAYALKNFKKNWDGDKNNESMAKHLVETAERLPATPEQNKDCRLASEIFVHLTGATRRPVTSSSKDNPSRLEDDSIAFGFRWLVAEINKMGATRIKEDDVADMLVRVKCVGLRVENLRFKLLTVESQVLLRRIADNEELPPKPL